MSEFAWSIGVVMIACGVLAIVWAIGELATITKRKRNE